MILTHGANSIGSGGNKQVKIGDKTYNCVEIGGKIWTCENLDYVDNNLTIGYPNSSTPKACYYNNDEAVYGWEGRKCGLLYNRYAFKYLEDNKASILNGFRVAKRSDYQTLFDLYAGNTGLYCRAMDSDWFSGWNGNDESGLNILPAGSVNTSTFVRIGVGSVLWAPVDPTNYSETSLVDIASSFFQFGDSPLDEGFSIRLVKDI